MEPASPQAVIGFILIVILLLGWACYELTKTTKDFQDKPPHPHLNIYNDEAFHQHAFEIPPARSTAATPDPQPLIRRYRNVPMHVVRDLYKATHHVQGGVREDTRTVYAVVPEGQDAADCDCVTERPTTLSRPGPQRTSERDPSTGLESTRSSDKADGIRGFP